MVLFGHEKAGAQDPKTPPPPPPPQPPVYAPPVTTFSSNTKTNNPTQSVTKAGDTSGDFLKELREKQKKKGLIDSEQANTQTNKPPVPPRPTTTPSAKPPVPPRPTTTPLAKQGTPPPPPPPPPIPSSSGSPTAGKKVPSSIHTNPPANLDQDELKKKIEASQARRNKK